MMSEELLERMENDSETEANTGASQEEITVAQGAAGIRFPPAYTQLLRRFNGGEFRELRLLSVGELATTSAEARAYVPAIAEGQVFAFGKSWAGDLFCFQLSKPAEDSEYPVLCWNHEYSEEPDDEPYLWETEAVNLADFLATIYTD